MDLKDITIVAIAEGVLLAVCVGLLLRAWWLIRWKNSVIDRYIRQDIERIDRKIKMDALSRDAMHRVSTNTDTDTNTNKPNQMNA